MWAEGFYWRLNANTEGGVLFWWSCVCVYTSACAQMIPETPQKHSQKAAESRQPQQNMQRDPERKLRESFGAECWLGKEDWNICKETVSCMIPTVFRETGLYAHSL